MNPNLTLALFIAATPFHNREQNYFTLSSSQLLWGRIVFNRLSSTLFPFSSWKIWFFVFSLIFLLLKQWPFFFLEFGSSGTFPRRLILILIGQYHIGWLRLQYDVADIYQYWSVFKAFLMFIDLYQPTFKCSAIIIF